MLQNYSHLSDYYINCNLMKVILCNINRFVYIHPYLRYDCKTMRLVIHIYQRCYTTLQTFTSIRSIPWSTDYEKSLKRSTPLLISYSQLSCNVIEEPFPKEEKQPSSNIRVCPNQSSPKPTNKNSRNTLSELRTEFWLPNGRTEVEQMYVL